MKDSLSDEYWNANFSRRTVESGKYSLIDIFPLIPVLNLHNAVLHFERLLRMQVFKDEFPLSVLSLYLLFL